MFLKPSGRPFPNSTSYKTVLTCYLIKLYTSFCLISWVSGSRSDHWNEPTVPFFWHADASYKCRTTRGYDFCPNGNGMNMPSCDYRHQIFGPKISGPFTIPRVCSPKRLRPITSQKHMSLSFEFLENIFLEQIQTKFLKDLYNSCTTLQLTQGVLKKLIKHPRFNIFISMIDQ